MGPTAPTAGAGPAAAREAARVRRGWRWAALSDRWAPLPEAADPRAAVVPPRLVDPLDPPVRPVTALLTVRVTPDTLPVTCCTVWQTG